MPLKKLWVTFIFSMLGCSLGHTDQSLISLFPLSHYDQTLATWIKPTDANFDKPLLTNTMQQKRLEIFYDHYFGAFSPWNSSYVTQILLQSTSSNIPSVERDLINKFDNEGKADNQIGYGENFYPYTKKWIENISHNMNVAQLDHLSYQPYNRGIAIDNLSARILPTDDVHFYSHNLAGQGYPFDNLQISALWAGTPVYIVGETRDRAWVLVMTPDYIGWVKSSGIARASDNFIETWEKAAKNKLVAITHTQTSIIDQQQNFLFFAYVGAVFPGNLHLADIQIMVPAADDNHHAIIKYAALSTQNAALMPLAITPHHFSTIMSTLIGRPYGWGNLYFYNDCSAELKSLFTPFGIWLPRHSSAQVNAGKIVDMSYSSQNKRLAYLLDNGQPFLTLIYIGGHVVLYIGNYPNSHDNNSLMAMTYQNLWALSPNPSTRRAVVGQAVLFPLLLQYPEDTSLVSLANDDYFQLSYLNQLPMDVKLKSTDIRLLMEYKL